MEVKQSCHGKLCEVDGSEANWFPGKLMHIANTISNKKINIKGTFDKSSWNWNTTKFMRGWK